MKSDEIKAKADRYNRIEKEADTWGRIIGVRRLKGSEEMRVMGMTADLDGSQKIIAEDGKEVVIEKRAPFLVAAMVCEVDGIPFTFPKTRGELDAVFDRLDREGREAAMKAFIRLAEADNSPEQPPQETVIETAKN